MKSPGIYAQGGLWLVLCLWLHPAVFFALSKLFIYLELQQPPPPRCYAAQGTLSADTIDWGKLLLFVLLFPMRRDVRLVLFYPMCICRFSCNSQYLGLDYATVRSMPLLFVERSEVCLFKVVLSTV